MKILWKTFYFDAAHSLPNYKGKCSCLHGHRWKVKVGIEGNIQSADSDTGMIVDFSKLKRSLYVFFFKMNRYITRKSMYFQSLLNLEILSKI